MLGPLIHSCRLTTDAVPVTPWGHGRIPRLSCGSEDCGRQRCVLRPISALSDPRVRPGRDRGLAGSGSFDQKNTTRTRLHSETADTLSSALAYSLHTGPLAYLEVTITYWRVCDEANGCLRFVLKDNLGSAIYDNGN